MVKFIKRGLFSVLTLIMIVALIVPTINASASNKAEGKFEMKVSYGIDGKYRAMKYVPVTVELKSLEEDFEGEVEIRVPSGQSGYYDAYSESVTVAKGETIKVKLPIIISESNNKFTVNLIENGKSILEQKAIGSTGRVTEGKVFAGVLTDDFTSLGYLGDSKYKDNLSGQEIGLEIVKLDSDIIGNNILNIDGLDVIFINNFNMGSLDEEHYNTLNTWVNKGGILIVGAGVNESKTVKAIDKSLLEVKSNGLSEKNVTVVNENLKLALSDLEIKNSKVKVGNSGEELIYSITKGKGEILVSTFDLGMEPFISSKDASEVWNELLLARFTPNKNQMMYGYYPYEVQNLISNIPMDKLVGFKTLATVFIVYALIIGVILYIVLKKIQKRDLIWIAVPTLAISFAIIIYMLGGGTRVNDIILNQVNIIDIDADGKSQVKGYVGVGTKYKSDVTLQKPEDIVMNYKSLDDSYYGNQEEQNEPLTNLRVKTSYKDGNSYFEFADSNALEMKTFEVLGKEEILIKIESNFNYDSGELKGVVKNNLDTNINKLVLISGENIWDLGSLKKGEELDVTNKETIKYGSFRAYADELSNKYWQLKYDKNVDIKSEEFKNISRYGNVLQVLSNELIFNNESKLIAITDMPIDYGIDFGKKSLSKYDTTVLVQNAEINFKDKDGNINYPQGYFKDVIESSTANVNVDEMTGDIYGSGEIVFNFEVDEKIKVLNIKLNLTESPYGNKGGNMVNSSEYYVYNYKSNSYEKINLTTANPIILTNAEDYSKDNIIKVKVIADDSGSGRVPSISIKGGVK